MNIENLGVIVTGAATGLGAATARLLSSRGARLALFDINQAKLAETAAETNSVSMICDVSDEGDVKSSVEKAIDQIGPIRAVVNVAGIGWHPRLLQKDGSLHSGEQFEKVIAVNLTGTFRCCKFVAAHIASLPTLADGARGVIINTSSISAFESPIGGIAYAASKAGVSGMTLPMARELGDYGIRVMTIAPGPFETPLFDGFKPEQKERFSSMMAFPKRPGNPRWFAELVEHIIANDFLTGEVIRIDGGARLPRQY